MVPLALSFAAGVLTVLSPCVLPALPVIVGSVAASRRSGPLALAAGLVLAFTAVGLAISTAGAFAAISEDTVRKFAALLLLASGMVLLSARLQSALSRFASPLASLAAKATGRAGSGIGGQFAVGALLGAVWSPCVGPTLGAAMGLAASGDSLSRAGVMMFVFGLGSATPLVAIAYGSRRALARRHELIQWAGRTKTLFGVGLLGVGVLVFSRMDRRLEAAVLGRLPRWWIDLLASL